jgi:hypothetical protein
MTSLTAEVAILRVLTAADAIKRLITVEGVGGRRAGGVRVGVEVP